MRNDALFIDLPLHEPKYFTFQNFTQAWEADQDFRDIMGFFSCLDFSRVPIFVLVEVHR